LPLHRGKQLESPPGLHCCAGQTTRTRRTVRLGKVTAKVANEVKLRVEAIIAAQRAGQGLDSETAGWLGRIGDDLHDRLAAVGLAVSRARSSAVTLAAYWNDFAAGKSRTLKPRSLVAMNQVRDRAAEFFGAAKRVADLSPEDAERFADWLRGEYAGPTAARSLKRMKQLFARAVKDRIIGTNPFEGIRPGGMSNPARLQYIPAADVGRVISRPPTWGELWTRPRTASGGPSSRWPGSPACASLPSWSR